MTRSKFIIVEHHAKKARLHWDLRFRMPNSKNWASFAVRKGVPTEPGKKVLAIRTHEHSEKEALYIGTIKDGYGAGVLKKWDSGDCIIQKYGRGHIVIEFKGRKVKGLYHLISTGLMNKKEYKKQQYLLFKGKTTIKEALYKDDRFDPKSQKGGMASQAVGMISRVPPNDTEEVEGDYNTQQKKKLPWALEFFKPKKPLNRIRHLKIIDKFKIDKSKALIIGSAVLVLHGVIEKNHDLDLVVTRGVLIKLMKKKGIKKDYKYKKVFYKTKSGNMEAAVNFQVMHTTTDKLLKRALDIDGYKFMSLKDTYKMYKILNRPKDKEKLDRLEKIFH